MRFYGGRFSLLPANSIFYMAGNENKFSFIISELKKNIEFRARKDTYIIIEPILDNDGNLLGGKIGRATRTKLPLRPDGNLEKVPITIFPHVLFIIDEVEHLILVERNSQVFSDPLVVFKYLCKYLNTKFIDKGIEVDIKPLTSKGAFWKLIKELDQIYMVSFKLKAPNFLGQSYKELKKILDQEKFESNANEIVFGISNDSGSLKIIENERYQAVVGWTEDGGGDWIIKGKSSGSKRKRTFSNKDHLSMFDVEIEYEEISLERLKMIRNKINIGKHKIKDEKSDV